MASITLKGNPIHTSGELPELGTVAPDFKLVATDLSEVSLKDYAGKVVVLSVAPSIDTGVCAESVRKFNLKASEDAVILFISCDLPFALSRFCGAEGIENVVPLSSFRAQEFGKAYGLDMVDGPLKGLLSRAVIVVGADGLVKYVEQVPEITQEPDYDAALKAI